MMFFFFWLIIQIHLCEFGVILECRGLLALQTDARGNTSPTRPSPRPLLPDGGLVATAEEMAQILLWLVQPVGVGPTPGVLSDSTIQAMLSGRFPIGNTVSCCERAPKLKEC
jgi:hypothetical protein